MNAVLLSDRLFVLIFHYWSEFRMGNVTRHTRNRRPETIKARLQVAVFPTVTALAAHLGRPRSLVSEVISGTTKSAGLAAQISALIGQTPADVWPRLYASSTNVPLASQAS